MYYNKSLEINPNYIEAINNRNDVKKKIAELEAKAEAQAPPKIVLVGSSTGTRTQLYGSRRSSKSSGTAAQKSERRYQVPSKVNKLIKAGLNQGQHLSSGPVFSPNTYR